MELITEKSNVHEKWYEDASKMTLDRLPEFLRRLLEDYGHDYGTICHAIAAGAVATAHAMNHHKSAGITGFQAGCVMWGMICNWMTEYKDKPLKLVDYSNMAYPQYVDNFDKTISQSTMDFIRKDVAKKLQESKGKVHPNVLAHWQNIVAGEIPFGYRIKEE